MKGITPIISIIVLLLITISLAGAAYIFLMNYMSGFMGQAISVPTKGLCLSDHIARVEVTNMGTDPIDLGLCTGAASITTDDHTCGDISIVRTDGGTMDGNFTATSIAASVGGELKKVVFKDWNCGDGTTPVRCEYAFTRAGELQPVTTSVECP